jgi:hypothetical protein
MRATSFRYRAAASVAADLPPCFHALRLPSGAPGDGPPCIRQRPLGIAGDWHGSPLRVRAPQRGARCIGAARERRCCRSDPAFSRPRGGAQGSGVQISPGTPFFRKIMLPPTSWLNCDPLAISLLRPTDYQS